MMWISGEREVVRACDTGSSGSGMGWRAEMCVWRALVYDGWLYFELRKIWIALCGLSCIGCS
jgi:hypothetical protein